MTAKAEPVGSFGFNITFDCVDPEAQATFWSWVTGYQRLTLAPAALDDQVVALEAPDSRGVRRMLFFPVSEPKTVKNRLHVDLAAKDPFAEVDRLVGLGATQVEYLERNGRAWTVMLDPEGNEFCIG